jgi:hypothetical protein
MEEQKKLVSSLLFKKKFPTPNSNYNPDWEYTIVSDSEHYLESYVTFLGCKDENGKEIVTGVLTAIINPYFHHISDEDSRAIKTPWTLYINDQDAQWLIKTFQDKYGKTEIKEGTQKGYTLSWKKKNLNVELSILADSYSQGKYYYRTRVRYELRDHIKEKVCKQGKASENY